MGFIIQGIANVFFELSASLLAIFIKATYDLNLNIGDPVGSKIKTINTFDEVFQGASSFKIPFVITALILAIIIVLLKLVAVNFAPITGSSEEPGALIFSAVIAIVGIILSYKIFSIFQWIANNVLDIFKKIETPDSKAPDADGVYNAFGTDAAKLVNMGDHTKDALNNTHYQSQESGDAGGNTAASTLSITVIGLAVFIVILIQFLKLFLEMYERYVVLGVLYFTCPLAFASLASRSTMNIFSSWLRMLVSQFLLMLMNVFFLNVYATSFYFILQRKAQNNGYIFSSFSEFMFVTLLWIGWLMVGQKVDQHLQSLGMSTAQSGGGLAGAVLAAGGTAYGLAKGAIGMTKGGVRRGMAGASASKGTLEEGGSGISAFGNGLKTAMNPMDSSKDIRREQKSAKNSRDSAKQESAQTRSKEIGKYKPGDKDSAMKLLDSSVGHRASMNTSEGQTLKDALETSGAMDELRQTPGFEEDAMTSIAVKDGNVSVLSAGEKEGTTFDLKKMDSVNPNVDGPYKSIGGEFGHAVSKNELSADTNQIASTLTSNGVSSENCKINSNGSMSFTPTKDIECGGQKFEANKPYTVFPSYAGNTNNEIGSMNIKGTKGETFTASVYEGMNSANLYRMNNNTNVGNLL